MKQLITGLLILLMASCAQVAPLTGGDKDVLPPKPLEAIPENGSLNYSDNKISIHFDEYIQLKDIFNQIIITPQLKEQPEINANGKTLNIQFNEKLRSNTTYKIFFGNAIADITEGNTLSDYEYSFSTGTFIDTLELRGTVKDAFTQKTIKDSWVMLYFDTNDSIVYRSKPDYLTKTNAAGEYKLKGLRKGEYKIVVLTDNNKNLMYDNGEFFGYHHKTVSVPDDSIINMELFKEKPFKVYITKTEHNLPEKATVVFNTGIDKLNSVNISATDGSRISKSSYYLNSTGDSIRFYFGELKYDSVKVKIGYNNDQSDSTYITFLSQEELKKQFERKRFPFELISLHAQGTTLPYHLKAYTLLSTFIIDSIHTGKLQLTENGKSVPADAVSIAQSGPDSIAIKYKWKPASDYAISLLKDFAKDKFNRGSDSLILKFKTNEKSDYGSLKFLLQRPGNINYIIQLINSANKVAYERYIDVLNSGDAVKEKNELEIKFTDVLPDTYIIRIISDTNNDKAFTPGSYIRKTQSEKINIYPQPIKIISDWDIEQNWDLGQ